MKILIIDDHVLIREALRSVLKELEADATVLEAPDFRKGVRHVADHPDLALILLDLNLPDRDGFAALRDLRKDYPGISIVVLSAFHDRINVQRAFDLGALGFIPKSAEREVMTGALKLVFSGGVYIPPEILARHDPAARAQPRLPRAMDEGQPATPADLGLTHRQIDVLALMMEGKSNKAICRRLDLAETTVKNHVTHILKVLKVTNRTEAVIAVTALGWDLPHAAGP